MNTGWQGWRDAVWARWLRSLGGCVLLAMLPLHAGAREVRVGIYENEPKVFLSTSGQPSGIFGEWLQELARQEDWVLQPVACEWQACLEALESGGLDLMPDVAYTEARAQRFDFHRTPALHSWSQLYRRPGDGIESLPNLQGRTVAVLAGSVQESFFRELLDGFGVRVRWLAVDSLKSGFEAVAARRADVVVANHRFGDYQAPRHGLERTTVMFQPSRLFFATGKNRNADLLEAIDRRLERWTTDPGSVYYEVLQRWGAEPPRTLVPQMVWWVLGGGLVLVLALLAAVDRMRHEMHRQTQGLQTSEEKLKTILEGVEASIFIKDAALRYQYANRKACEWLGIGVEQMLGRRDTDFFDAETAQKLKLADERVLLAGSRVEGEEVLRRQDGGIERVFYTVKIPLRNKSGHIYALCGIATDITEHRKIQEENHRLAFYDPLTALPNRRLFMERLEFVLASSARNGKDGALLFIDLDDFKIVNDTLGHGAGDELLRQIAQRLGQHLRKEDTLARLGGDEFVLMLHDLSEHRDEAAMQVEQVLEKIRNEVTTGYVLQGRQHGGCTASIGVALFSDAGGRVEELLKLADMAMYDAKAQGHNTVRFFNPAMQAQVQARVELERDLRTALMQGQFVLHYQPQTDGQGRMFGAEALLRWNHPERGLLAPGAFIAVAEQSGLILPIGEWVLQAACLQLVEWAARPETATWKVAVNVSARQFLHPDFVAHVRQALDQSRASAALLELELTESQLVDNFESVIEKMSALRDLGVHFSLDDFGTGYSSLSYIKRLPIHKLKIDQTFVRDLLVDDSDAAIVRTIVALGHSLELEVLAEGVETQAHREALAALGCRQYQGYLFGRPVPAGELVSNWASRT